MDIRPVILTGKYVRLEPLYDPSRWDDPQLGYLQYFG